VGFILPATKQLFSSLIPLALLLSSMVIIWFHRPGFSIKMILIFGFIFVFSLFTEIAGVKTGMIFGTYSYGSSLGIQLFETPVMIGLNWLMLVYCTKIIAEKFFRNKKVILVIAPVLMVVYDLAMEQVAPLLDMWSWNQGKIPVRNYLVWFLLALFFHWLLQKSKLRFTNKMALPVFTIQLLFFVLLFLYDIFVNT
jgi:bisanhydrobacterioruberin hydratase